MVVNVGSLTPFSTLMILNGWRSVVVRHRVMLLLLSWLLPTCFVQCLINCVHDGLLIGSFLSRDSLLISDFSAVLDSFRA